MEEKQDLQQFSLSSEVIRQGFSNQLKELTLLNEHSPRIFMVYTHSLYEQEEAQSLVVKQIQGYLNPTPQAPCPSRGGHLNLNLYSGLAPQGNGTDTYNEYKAAEVLYRQIGLLPKHEYSADYVILCGSDFLQEYSEIEEVEQYTNSLRKMLSAELSKQKPSFNKLYTAAESALYTFKDRCKERNQRFHPVYTELAFLQLRSEEKYKDILPPHNLITLIIDRPSAISSSDVQGNSIDMGTAASLEKDAKAFYLAIFQLLSRLFGNPELDICRKAIENAHRAFKKNTNLGWTAEEAKKLAERQNNYEQKIIYDQKYNAEHSFFAPSGLNEENFLTKALPRTVCKATTVIDTAEITEVLRATYQQKYATLPRLFLEEAEAIADTFVNVAILKEEVVKAKEKVLGTAQEKEEKQDAKEMQDNRLQSHERLYEVHETIAIGKLFAPLSDTLSPKKLLLYGRAGIGKTVLCQYLATQWAEKPNKAKPDNMACFRQFQAVFWIPLRELMLVDTLKDRREHGKSLKREMLIAEMVTACCLQDWQEKKKKQQLRMWLKANAESTLFILDGYDEIAEVVATSCALSDCLHAILHQIQYKPYVMLTSRPVAIDTRYGPFDRRLECMGFIDKNIPVFVERHIKDVQQSKNCLTFLKSHPSIWGTAHIPLNLELLCWLWPSGELSVDNSYCTMAALYSQITTKMKEINVDVQKHPSLTARWQYADNQFSETTLADFAEEFFPFLGFHAMQQPGVLLKGNDIKRWSGKFIKTKDTHQREGTAFEEKQRKLLQACVDLSFLKSTQQGGKHLFDHTYYFIHLSFQEFFAAKYYQQAFEHSDTEIIKHFRTHKYTPSYQLTWWMTAGLLYQDGNDLGLRAFFQTLCTEPHDLIGIYHANLLSHCLDECLADEKVDIVMRLTQHLAGFLKRLLKKDWLADTWGKTLLYCPNLLRAKSFQEIGFYFFENTREILGAPSNSITLLLHLATQKAFAYVAHPTFDSDSRVDVAPVLAKHPDLTPSQIQSLIACLTDTTMYDWGRGSLAQALAQRLDLTPKQIQYLLTCLTDTTMVNEVRSHLALALPQHPDLTSKQIQSLFAFLTDRTIDFWVRGKLAEALAQRLDLTPEQIQSLFAYLTDTTVHNCNYPYIQMALAKHPDLTLKQIQSLITCFTNTTMEDWEYRFVAEALIQRPDLTPEHIQSLFACLADTTIGDNIRIQVAEALAQRLDLTPEQIQSLFAYLTDTTIDVRSPIYFVPALAKHPNLPAEQIQSFFAYLADTAIRDNIRIEFAKVLAQRLDLTPEQIQSLFACLTDTTIDVWAPILAQALAQHSIFNAKQLQQLLVYCLQKEVIYKEYPFLIFSILITYYSTNQIEQQEYIVLPGLNTFLTRPSTWSALASQQVLFLYNKVTGIASLRLGTQTIEMPLQLHPNPFLKLCHKIWKGSLHPIKIERIFRQQIKDYSLLQATETGQSKKIETTTTTLPSLSASTMNVTLPTIAYLSVAQDSRSLEGKASESTFPRLELTQVLQDLIEDSISTTKNYAFQLKRTNAFLLTIIFISSNESSRAVGRQLDALQREMEACLQTANIKNYVCKLKGKEEEILEVTGDKEVINALADLLVHQGLSMRPAEASKYSAFFKAEKALGTENTSIFTCPMQ